MKFGYLFLRKIFKFVATRCQILRLKCSKFNFGWGSAPDPTGELTALPRPIAVFKRPTCKGGEGKGWGMGGWSGKGRKEREGRERRKGKGRGGCA